MDKHGAQINELILKKLHDLGIDDISEGFSKRMRRYLFEPEYSYNEKRILKASHYLATSWEFNIVYRLSENFSGWRIQKNIEKWLEEHRDIDGVKQLIFNKGATDFKFSRTAQVSAKMGSNSKNSGNLSCWSHVYCCSILSYLLTLQLDPCEKRKYNNYFAGLFHDMPEVLTRI